MYEQRRSKRDLVKNKKYPEPPPPHHLAAVYHHTEEKPDVAWHLKLESLLHVFWNWQGVQIR